MSVVPSGLVPVHVGQLEPGSEHDQHLRTRAAERDRMGRRDLILQLPGDLDWQKHGLQPRWLGMESSDCPVAIEPGIFASRGADERRRFLAGAARRGETALLVSVIGDPDGDGIRSPLSRADASVHVGDDAWTSVTGRRLPTGSPLELARDLGKADRDLALRLRNRPPTAPWWALDLHGVTTERGDGFGGPTVHEPQGRLEPILVNNLGEPVAAAWVSDDESLRWYVLPAGIDWDTVLDWLMQQALPELNPAALRRVRSPRFIDPDLQSREELTARQDLAELEERYADEKARLERRLLAAREQAEPLRHGLLYEAGAPLVDAVRTVLAAAGLHVLDLDQELGATKSADLLVSLTAEDTPRHLVEIKGVGGTAPENLVRDLQRHLDTWPQLRPQQPVAGGVLIVNHQHKLDPSERSREVYTRREFVDALQVTVLSARQLFDWWREEDWAAIRAAVLGNITTTPPSAPTVPQPSAEATTAPTPPTTTSRWRWRGRTQR